MPEKKRTPKKEKPTKGIPKKHSITGRVAHTQTSQGITGLYVELWDNTLTYNDKIASATTDKNGTFLLEFKEQDVKDVFLKRPAEMFFKVYHQDKLIMNTQNSVLWNEKAKDKEIVIKVDLQTATKDEPRAPAKNLEITELKKQLKQGAMPNALLKSLNNNGIKTLADIRRKGGIAKIEGLPDIDENVIKKLDAHAYLSLLSDNPKVTEKLIDAGYYNITDISASPKSDFLKKAEPAGIDTELATTIHAKSRVASAVMTNLVTGIRAEAANNYSVKTFAEFEDEFPPECQCRDCESAVSPLAYLTELLDYTFSRVLKNDDNFIDELFLIENFYQPFTELKASCEEVNNKVRQVRICIEVLRKFLENNPPKPENQELLLNREKEYLFQSYKMLLNEIGTSFNELRLIKTADQNKREALANRLGIDLGDVRPDELDNLLLAPEGITEEKLELLFGLIDTTRDPLLKAVIQGDDNGQITRINLNGIQWNWNTDPLSSVFISVKETATNVFRIDVFSDASKTKLVASGELQSSDGTVILTPENDSGLFGSIDILDAGDVVDIEASVLPYYLCLRLRHLRTLWKQQDWPSHAYSEGDLPIIDPDIIGPDDFRKPFSKQNSADPDKAFDLWIERREWVDQKLEQLDAERKINGFEYVLKTVLGDPLPNLDRILENLNNGKNPEETEGFIHDLNLTVESFTRLMEIRAKDVQHDCDSEADEVSVEEWFEVNSILVQVLKKREYVNWINIEGESEIKLDPKLFWTSQTQPIEGDWPPLYRSLRPVIDPQLINSEDLMEPIKGSYANVVWQSRQTKLDQIYRELELEQMRPSTDPFAILKYVFGDPLPHNPVLIYQSLINDVSGAKTIVRKDFIMTVSDFMQLMGILTKEKETGTKPTKEEWSEVYRILTSAYKYKILYPSWIREENELPLIDPDNVKIKDLPDSTAGENAIKFWYERKLRIERVYDNLKVKWNEDDAFNIMVKDALGHPNPGDALPHELETLLENLNDNNIDIVYAAIQKITNDLLLTVEGFTQLMEFKQKFEDNSARKKISKDEWQVITLILAQAQKAKREYPIWKTEENDSSEGGMHYWNALKTKIPQWRATFEARMQWLQALKYRSQAPIIDPDIITDNDLKNLHNNNQAYAILQKRKPWRESQFESIKKIRDDEKTYMTLKWGTSGTDAGQFDCPNGVAVDGNGNVYVVDRNNHRIQKFDEKGNFILEWGEAGDDNGHFDFPSGITIDNSGYVYIADTHNHRIQKFNSSGVFQTKWGSYGISEGEFKYPNDVAVDNDGNIYVADTENGRIQKIDPNGKIKVWGKDGNWSGKFNKPSGIIIDNNSMIYIADFANHQIYKFDLEGNLKLSWGAQGRAAGKFQNPCGLAADEKGFIFVADSGNNRIQKFDSSGRFLMKWGRRGSGNGQFILPRGIAIHGKRAVYVTDSENNRIQKFDPTVSGIEQVLLQSIGVSIDKLITIANDYEKGNDISDQLLQLNLTVNALLYINRIHLLVSNGEEVMDSEWDGLYSILIQVIKCRTFAAWREEEQERDILLSPDFFMIAEERPEELPQWRASWETRWDWEDKLQSRMNQENTATSAMAEVIDNCEETTLTMLRDALIDASDATGNSLPEKAKWLTERLLIDCEMGACQKTTRPAQAITTIQNFLWSLRTGQLEELELSLVEDESYNFDNEWKWIGSYETWKAAVGVFLYPENILLPSLRKVSTNKFRDILQKALTSGMRFNSSIASQLVTEYGQYLKDTCMNLQIIDVVHCYLGSDSEPEPYRVYVIARGEHTKKYYICQYDYDSTQDSIYNHRGWNEICEIERPGETEVIGAVNYLWENGNYLYLFFWYENTLNFIKHDVKSQLWDSQIKTLDIPETSDYMTAGIMKGRRGDCGPIIVIKVYNKLYVGRVSEEQWTSEPKIIDNNFAGGVRNILFIGSSSLYNSFVIINNIFSRQYEGLWFWLFTAQEYGEYKMVGSYELKTDNPVKGWLPKYENNYGNRSLSNLYVLSGTASETYFKSANIDWASITFDENERLLNTNITSVKTAIPSWELNMQRDTSHVAICLAPGVKDGNDMSFVKNPQYYHSLYSDNEDNLIDLNQSNLIAISVSEIVDLNLASEYRYPFTKELFDYYGDNAPPFLIKCIEEGFYFLPVLIALNLQQAGQYIAALDWFKKVYEYTNPLDEKKIYYGLVLEESNEVGYETPENWLIDPLDVHGIASCRNNTYTRFTIISIIRCLLVYADAEFTRDTTESLAKAKILYEKAIDLLNLPELNQHIDYCDDIVDELKMEFTNFNSDGEWSRILNAMTNIKQIDILKTTAERIRQIMNSSADLSTRFAEARVVVSNAKIQQRPHTISDILNNKKTALDNLPKILMKNDFIAKSIEYATLSLNARNKSMYSGQSSIITSSTQTGNNSYIPSICMINDFCIPWNPMIRVLRFCAENNLLKLRTCRNIAGVKREIETYAAPIDVLSAMPSIGPSGQLILPIRILPPPVPYRYEFLIERTKQLANMAAQMEAAFLSAIEKRDMELYNQLKARQDVQLARAGVRLQNLRVSQAQEEVKLAELQKESAQIQVKRYEEWLVLGLNQWELDMITAYHDASDARKTAAEYEAAIQSAQALTSCNAGWSPGAAISYATAVAAAAYKKTSEIRSAIEAEAKAQVVAVWASYERRTQEWELQRDLALQSTQIGDQQIKIANDGVKIVEQEKNIAQMQVEHSEAIVEFLQNKETNFELYDWMTGVLEGVYGYFLQQATSMAKLAQNQLAFERQQLPPAFIQDDYWEVPSDDMMGGMTENAVDRHGFTGSARLLADIYKLDQYRLETEKRKLQLTKVISLARLAPFEFQQLKETGNIVFMTPMELFDMDFPGHHLRLIKRVRTSVIALVPTTQGIKATLTNVGISRVIVNSNGLFQSITAYRPPESVALTSPSNATGLFELETQSEMMLPFEGLGVDTAWEFRMPRAANQFDYSTIADILIAIEYTALDSYDYRQQVIETLRSKISAERPFSFRHQFADQWYDLHNADQSVTPMTVKFTTRREDFPPNLDRLKIDQILLYFARSKGAAFEVAATLTFKSENGLAPIGGEATSAEGVISTRRGNAGSWSLMIGEIPVGEWELKLPNIEEIKNRFKNEEIEDILFVITFSGQTPEWPE